MKVLPAILLSIALVGCSKQPAKQDSAEDFANRIGGVKTEGASPAPEATSTPVNTAIPDGVDALALDPLGQITAVDLGPRAGTCAFSTEGVEQVIAAANPNTSVPGFAAARVGGTLLRLAGKPGGMAALRDGTVLTAQGVTMTVVPEGPQVPKRSAKMTVSDAAGQSKVYNGYWSCS